MKAIAVLVLVMSLTACGTIMPKIGPQIAKGVTRYCVEPLAERQLVRESVNSSIAPNKIVVTCVGDPQ